MLRFLKIFLVNLILCLSVFALHSTTISDQSKDNNTKNHNNIKHSYDNSLSDIVKTNNHNTIKYNVNDQVNNQLSTESHLERIENTTNYAAALETEETLLHSLLFKLKRESEKTSCLLDSLKTALIWWSCSNGTLKTTNSNFLNLQQVDLSYHNLRNDAEVLNLISNIPQNMATVAFSLAYNKLKIAPFRTLQIMRNNLKYLSLMGNPFIDSNKLLSPLYILNEGERQNLDVTKTFKYKRVGLNWAKFPYMPSLLELDISDCGIEFIDKRAFQNLTNLKNLYMAHNKLLTIPSDTFYYTPSLQVLDLSFTNIYDWLMKYIEVYSPSNIEYLMKYIYGVNIEKHMFRYLPNLRYLDLSHTKLSRSSAIAFTHIGPNLNYLSLCYTSFPVFGKGILRRSSLIGLDLSGNVHAAYSITEDAFEGLSENLTYLYFEKANLRDLSWLRPFKNLRVLALAGNNINTLSAQHFSGLKHLQILDLTSNQVGNWYSQVFVHNTHLRVLSLRDNNINILTSEMLKDFSMLTFLSLGNNNFLCDCLLRDLVEVSAVNNKLANCKGNDWQDPKNSIYINSTHLTQVLQFSELFLHTNFSSLDIPSLILSQNLQKLKPKSGKLGRAHNLKNEPKIPFIMNTKKSYRTSNNCLHIYNAFNLDTNKNMNSSLFKLQLLDYEDEQYWCYNETKRENVNRLNCQRSTLIEDIEDELNTLNIYILSSLVSFIFLALLGISLYYKRWHIYYYYSFLKSAALLAVVSKDNLKKFKTLSDQNPNMIYDIFISYCESDRDWIVEEFIPNVEKNGDISICLHERDFQVGVTILDNIVSCMERSKALMFIVSSNFLLSHWCQFEMQLAQQHIFDLSKEHLILVLLEDIPRSKRPKNLQFLMNVKTYIKWPGGKCKDVHPEERKLFWKRLKLTLKNLGLPYAESKA